MTTQERISAETRDAAEASALDARRPRRARTPMDPDLDNYPEQARGNAFDAIEERHPHMLPDGTERKPFGEAEQQLAYEAPPGYRLYWFNDVPGRIVRAKQAGYDHVTDRGGDPICRVTGRGERGEGAKSYLMKIPIEWYEEDRAASQRREDKKMRQIREGRYMQPADSNQYVPRQGIKISHDRR